MSDTHIKINAVTPRVQYTGNGVTTTFPYEFAIFDETDMVVYVGDDIIESGYTVTGAGETEGGTVVFDTAPANGVKITLLRDVPIERVTDFQEGGTFRPKNLNDEFDRQTAFVQQVQEKLDRTLILPPTTEIDPSQILGEVERIYESIDNVDAVADNETNINAVADNETNINTCASNIAAIIDAPNQAAAAASSAQDAAASAASLDVTNIAHKNEDNTFIKTNTYNGKSTSLTSVIFKTYNTVDTSNGISFANSSGYDIGSLKGSIGSGGNTSSVGIRAYRPGTAGNGTFEITMTRDNGDGVFASSGVKKDIVGWTMPSNTADALTLGASGTSYTMPKDGYICLGATFDAQGYIYLYSGTTPRYGITIPYNANQWVDIYLNVKKGDVIIVQYNGNATVQYFNFICAQGEV